MRPGPTVRAAGVLAAFLALFLLVDRLSGDGREPPLAAPTTRPAPTRASAAPPTTATAAPATTRPPATTRRPAPATTRRPPATTATRPALRPARGVTVQVLNGTRETGLARRVAARIRAQGYTVIATNTAFGTYPVSRIYYSPGHLEDAEAFRARNPAFAIIAPAPNRLSFEVDLHAVVGHNYPG